MRIVVLLIPASLWLSACNPTAPSEVPPRTHVDLAARLTTVGGVPVEGARVIIKTSPGADGRSEHAFTGFLMSGADGVAMRTAGPFTGGRLDSVEVFATPPSACTWNPVRAMIRAIALDTLPASGLEVAVELPDTLTRARTEVGILCAQGTELPSVAGHLSYDLFLEIQEINGSVFSGTWALQSSFHGWADGVFAATAINGVVGMVLTPTDDHELCSEIRLMGTIDPEGTWNQMDVVTEVRLEGWPCVPAGHRYRFFKSKLTALP